MLSTRRAVQLDVLQLSGWIMARLDWLKPRIEKYFETRMAHGNWLRRCPKDAVEHLWTAFFYACRHTDHVGQQLLRNM